VLIIFIIFLLWHTSISAFIKINSRRIFYVNGKRKDREFRLFDSSRAHPVIVLILGFLNLHRVKVMSRSERNPTFGYELAGVVFIVIIGSMLHFTFELSGHQPVFGVFSAVNEVCGSI